LPKSVERGNLSLDNALIRWMSGGESPHLCTSPWRVPGRGKVFA
jgi:hypothetical protein